MPPLIFWKYLLVPFGRAEFEERFLGRHRIRGYYGYYIFGFRIFVRDA